MFEKDSRSGRNISSLSLKAVALIYGLVFEFVFQSMQNFQISEKLSNKADYVSEKR